MDHSKAAPQEGMTTVEFNDVNEPGAYITAEGSLVRFQPDALKEGHSPLITVTSNLDRRLTKISGNPNIAVGKARVVAADADLPVSF